MDRSHAVALAGLLILVAPLGAQHVLTLTDGTATRGSLAGIGSDGSFSWRGATGAVTYAADRVVCVESGEAASPHAPGTFRIDLRSGDSVVARIEDGTSDDVRVRSAAFGEATFQLDDIVAIWNLDLPRSPESLPPPRGDAETLYKDSDGRVDPLPGRLERVAKTHVVFSSVAGQDRPFHFGRDRVIAVRLPAAGTAPAAPAPATILLKDGSRLSGALRPSDGGALALDLAVGPDLVLDLRQMRSLTLRNANLSYLSDLEPKSFEETPLFEGVIRQGLARDRGLRSGDPLRIGSQTFTKGVMVPARARLVYAIDGGFKRFVANVGADGATMGRDISGAVRVKVSVDGAVRYESRVLRAGQPPETVEITGLDRAAELVIEVDFADSFDAGARAVFGNALLVR